MPWGQNIKNVVLQDLLLGQTYQKGKGKGKNKGMGKMGWASAYNNKGKGDANSECRHREKVCDICGVVGHLKGVCHKKPKAAEDANNVGAKAPAAGAVAAASNEEFAILWTCMNSACYHRNLDHKLQKCQKRPRETADRGKAGQSRGLACTPATDFGYSLDTSVVSGCEMQGLSLRAQKRQKKDGEARLSCVRLQSSLKRSVQK